MQTLPAQNSHQPYHDEHLFVDLRYELVTLDRQMLALSRKEYSLLALMVQHAGKIVPRATFLMQVWGYVPETRTRTVDMAIDQLRKKLGPYADQYIETVVGIGYRFRPMPWLPQSGTWGA
jgi:two-component system, OmpR family, KDP operon response regulator KdpE